MFRPSVRHLLGLCRFVLDLLCPLLTSARASRHLSISVAHGTPADLPGYDAPTFTLMPVGYTPLCSVQVLGFDDKGRLTPQRRLISASCSSCQRFASGFLQIRSHPRHPCLSANSSPCRASRGLSPPSKCALPGAPLKNLAKHLGEAFQWNRLSIPSITDFTISHNIHSHSSPTAIKMQGMAMVQKNITSSIMLPPLDRSQPTCSSAWWASAQPSGLPSELTQHQPRHQDRTLRQ